MADSPNTIAGLHHEMVQEFKHTNAAIAEVKVLAQDTNGRVTELELEQARAEGQTSGRFLKHRLIQKAFRTWFDLYRRALGYKTDPLPDQDKLAEYASQYYETHLRGGEGHLEVGKNIMIAKEKHAHMMVSLKPFGCMTSTMSDGVQSRAGYVSEFPDAASPSRETGRGSTRKIKSSCSSGISKAGSQTIEPIANRRAAERK